MKTTLTRVVADDSVKITFVDDGTRKPAAASPLTDAIVKPLERVTARMWPGLPVIPQMETGATDGTPLRQAGIPTYGVSGVFLDMDDIRAHGRDERILVKSFYDGVEYVYQLVREYAG